jgi:hemolysin D
MAKAFAMRPSRRRLSNATSSRASEDATALAAILEFESPSAAIVATPTPPAARGIVWVVGSLFAACAAALGLIHVDRVVSAAGRVVSKEATIVVQPLEAAIVRSIDVREGQLVRAGEELARLDPTFAAADVGALQAQVAGLNAEVTRMQAEVEERPFQYSGPDPSLSLQAAIYAQRQSERNFKLEYYREKIDGLDAAVARADADITAFRRRQAVAQDVETMRKRLEALQVGSRLNTLAATDSRLEIERNLATAIRTRENAKDDLAAMIAERDGYLQNWRAQIAQTLSEETRKLSDARESLRKALLRRRLVELRADHDATVLTIAKVSEGSVLQPGEQFITLVPTDAPLEIEANIPGRDDGFVHVGDPVAIKFDTFPFSRYGLAAGTVRVISPDSFTADQQMRPGAGIRPESRSRADPYYRARVAIDRVYLHDVPAHFHIVPGMPVTADIKVGKVTVLGYLLGRVLTVVSEGMREP